ncbi:MAG: hypothetical protein QXP81_10260 [Nitrososphaerota archaeon]
MKCPVCNKGDMLMYRGLPESLNLVKMVEEHPIPILRNWVSEKASELLKELEKKYFYRKCDNCGLILIFEVV